MLVATLLMVSAFVYRNWGRPVEHVGAAVPSHQICARTSRGLLGYCFAVRTRYMTSSLVPI